VVYVEVSKLSVNPVYLTDYYNSSSKFPIIYTYRITIDER